MHLSKQIFLIVCIQVLVSPLMDAEDSRVKTKTLPMKRIGKLDFKPIDEPSGLVRSRLWPDWIWTHNDSGDHPRIFAVQKDGSIVLPEKNSKSYKGITIPNAVNIDWEDIATDDQGNLILGACGNNSNARRDLALYIVPEVNATQQNMSRAVRTISFRYPDQKAFPPAKLNFDCEAIFHARGKIHLLSKNRANSFTKLYRFDTIEDSKVNVPTLVQRFDVKGQVTGADVNTDGTQLAILTYNRVWLFKVGPHQDNYFEGSISWGSLNRFRAKQCEGICFWNNKLIICNEQGDLYEISTEDLYKLQP